MDRDDLFVGGSTVSGDRDLCPTSPIHLYISHVQGPIFVLLQKEERKVNSTPSFLSDVVTATRLFFLFFSRANRTSLRHFREKRKLGSESHALAPANGP